LNTLGLYGLTVLIWGSSWLAIHFQIGVVAPEVSIIYRFVLASVVLVGWCTIRGISLRIDIRHHFYLAMMGFCLFLPELHSFLSRGIPAGHWLAGRYLFDDHGHEHF